MSDAWRIVDRAAIPPAKCLVSGDIDGPFLDLGIRVPYVDPHVYLHLPIAEAIGRAVGMVPKAEVEDLQERVAAAEAELASLRDKADAIERLEAVFAS